MVKIRDPEQARKQLLMRRDKNLHEMSGRVRRNWHPCGKDSMQETVFAEMANWEKYLWCAIYHAANPWQRAGARERAKKHCLSLKVAEQHCRVARVPSPTLTLHKALLRVGSSSCHHSIYLKQMKKQPHHPHSRKHLPEKLCQVSYKQQLVPTVICNKRDTNCPGRDCRRLLINILQLDLGKGLQLFLHYTHSSPLTQPGHSEFASQCLNLSIK